MPLVDTWNLSRACSCNFYINYRGILMFNIMSEFLVYAHYPCQIQYGERVATLLGNIPYYNMTASRVESIILVCLGNQRRIIIASIGMQLSPPQLCHRSPCGLSSLPSGIQPNSSLPRHIVRNRPSYCVLPFFLVRRSSSCSTNPSS